MKKSGNIEKLSRNLVIDTGCLERLKANGVEEVIFALPGCELTVTLKWSAGDSAPKGFTGSGCYVEESV